MLLNRNKDKKQLIKRKRLLIGIFVLVMVIAVFAIAYEKWCEFEARPLISRLEQIANHKIKVDSSANEDEVFSKSSIRVSYILLLGNSGKIKLNWINEYKESNSENLHTIITQVVLYVELIDDQWVIKDMMALA